MSHKIIVDANMSDPPKSHEFAAAVVIAEYFQSDVNFVRSESFKTPDFNVGDMSWELKSPIGGSAKTIENNMRAARKQSVNIIIDLSRIKMHQQQAIARIKFYLSKSKHFKKVLVVTKTRKVIVVQHD